MTQTVPVISPLMPMHQDPLLVSILAAFQPCSADCCHSLMTWAPGHSSSIYGEHYQGDCSYHGTGGSAIAIKKPLKMLAPCWYREFIFNSSICMYSISLEGTLTVKTPIYGAPNPKIWVGPESFSSSSYINFGKIVLRSDKFQILFLYFEDCWHQAITSTNAE